MDPFKIQRKLNVSWQYGWDGVKKEMSLSNITLSVLGIVLITSLIFSLVYVFSLRNMKQTQASLEKIQKENTLLRKKLDYYSGVIDTIFQKLDTLQVRDDSRGAGNRYYSFLNHGKAEEIIEDNSFIYDSYLDAKVNSLEGKVRKIATGLNLEKHSSGSYTTLETERVMSLDTGPSIFPTFGRWSDGWGVRLHPIYNRLAFHYGVDISNKVGTPIYATSDGEVVETGYDSEYGKLIRIKHANEYETRYGHLYNFQVISGDKVKKGQIIAMMGSTGMSTGPHLHYEVLYNGAKVNPSHYLNRIDTAMYYATQ